MLTLRKMIPPLWRKFDWNKLITLRKVTQRLWRKFDQNELNNSTIITKVWSAQLKPTALYVILIHYRTLDFLHTCLLRWYLIFVRLFTCNFILKDVNATKSENKRKMYKKIWRCSFILKISPKTRVISSWLKAVEASENIKRSYKWKNNCHQIKVNEMLVSLSKFIYLTKLNRNLNIDLVMSNVNFIRSF